MSEPTEHVWGRQKPLTDQQNETIARMRRRGLTPPVDWAEVERRRQELFPYDDREPTGGAIAAPLIVAVIVLVIVGIWMVVR